MNYHKADMTFLPELIHIRLCFLEECFGQMDQETISMLTDQMQHYLNKELNHSLFAYVASDDKKIISSAFLIVQEKPANPHFLTGKTGLILNVYTLPEARRNGYAKTLIELLLSDARQMNLSYVALNATECGRPLYEKLGFCPVELSDTPMQYHFSYPVS